MPDNKKWGRRKHRKHCSGGVATGGWSYAAFIPEPEHDEAEDVMNHDIELIFAESLSWFTMTCIQNTLSDCNENEKEKVIINNVLMLLTQISDDPNHICSILEKSLVLLNTKCSIQKRHTARYG